MKYIFLLFFVLFLAQANILISQPSTLSQRLSNAKITQNNAISNSYSKFSMFGSLFFNQKEKQYRKMIYQQTTKIIQKTNKIAGLKYKLGHNRFSQITLEEWISLYLGLIVPKQKQIVQFSNQNLSLRRNLKQLSQQDSTSTYRLFKTIKLNIDWTRQGVVTEPKMQGGCGSCYAFATIGSLQSIYMMKNKTQYNKIDLSEQQIIDCSGQFGTKGCNGGWIGNSYKYMVKYGSTTQQSYPYTAQKAPSCKQKNGQFKINKTTGGWIYSCSKLTDMLKVNPVTVGISAGTFYWKQYSGGILNQCGSYMDHAVLLVGVYEDLKDNYWIIKNSMGVKWGENGYLRLDRKQDDTCMICEAAFSPVL